jgi:hypothetical protein
VKSLPHGWVRAMQDAIYEDQESNKQGKRSKTKRIAKYKKQHKDVATKSVKKKYRMTKKPYSSSIVGATLEVMQKRQTVKPEGRQKRYYSTMADSISCFPNSSLRTRTFSRGNECYMPFHTRLAVFFFFFFFFF